MNTTSLFVELFITGGQVTIWLFLFILSFTHGEFSRLFQFKEPGIIYLILALTVAYPLGVMFDNLTDLILSPLDARIARKLTGGFRYSMWELVVKAKNERLLDYFEYVRRRIRITRSAIFNFPLITISLISYTSSNADILADSLSRIRLIEAIIGTIVTALAISNWINLTQKFRKQIINAYKLLGIPGAPVDTPAR